MEGSVIDLVEDICTIQSTLLLLVQLYQPIQVSCIYSAYV